MEMQIADTNAMRKVKLVARTGEFVQNVEILPFLLMPEILLWGARYFTRETDAVYKEGFCFPVPPYGPIIPDDDGETD